MNITIKEGDKVRLETGEIGTVVSVNNTGNLSYPFVFEVQANDILHITNNVRKINKLRNLATLISIAYNN